jgi:hypothetical protein
MCYYFCHVVVLLLRCNFLVRHLMRIVLQYDTMQFRLFILNRYRLDSHLSNRSTF